MGRHDRKTGPREDARLEPLFIFLGSPLPICSCLLRARHQATCRSSIRICRLNDKVNVCYTTLYLPVRVLLWRLHDWT